MAQPRDNLTREPVLWRRPGWLRAPLLALLTAGLLVYGSLLPWGFDVSGHVSSAGGVWPAVWAWLSSPRWIAGTADVSSYGVPVWVSDLVLNLLLYGPLGVLLRLTASRITGKQVVQILAGCFTIVLLSWLIESTQSLIPGRYASLQDVLFNSAGGVTGVLLGHRVNSGWRWLAFAFYRRSAGLRYRVNEFLSQQKRRPVVLFAVLVVNAGFVGLWYWVTRQSGTGDGGVHLLPFSGYFSRSYDVAAVLLGRSLVVYCLLGGLLMVVMMRGRTRAALGWVMLTVALLAGSVEVLKLLSGGGHAGMIAGVTSGGGADVTEPLLGLMAGGFVLTLGFMLMHACRSSCRRHEQRPVSVDRRRGQHDYRFSLSGAGHPPPGDRTGRR